MYKKRTLMQQSEKNIRKEKYGKLHSMSQTREDEGLVPNQNLEIDLCDLIPAEVSLETIGFFTPSSKRLKHAVKEKTVIQKNKEGELLTKTLKIIPSLDLGLPISVDLDYYRAFQKILYEYIQEEGDLTKPIPFSTRQIIRLAGKSYSKQERDNVRTWLQRMVSTTIRGELYNQKLGSYLKFDGPPFSQVVSKGDRLGDGSVAESNLVWLAPYYRESFASGYLRPVDLEFHRALNNNISKSLYPILETGFHASSDTVYRKSYKALCEDFKLTQYKHKSRVQQQLDPSFKELYDHHYLGSWSYREAQSGDGDFVITTEPGTRYFFYKEEQSKRKERWLALKKEQSAQVDERVQSQREDLMEAITGLCGGSSTDFAYLKIIKTEHPELIRTALSETHLAGRQGTIKKTKRQYFFWMLKQLKSDREQSNEAA